MGETKKIGVNYYFGKKGTIRSDEQVVSTAGLNHDALSSAVGPESGGTIRAQNESVWGSESLWATGERLRSVAGESIESDLPILLLSRTVEVKKRFGVQTGGKNAL